MGAHRKRRGHNVASIKDAHSSQVKGQVKAADAESTTRWPFPIMIDDSNQELLSGIHGAGTKQGP